MTAKNSSIHANGGCGDDDNLRMAHLTAQACYAVHRTADTGLVQHLPAS